MTVQTTYTLNPDAGLEGLPVDAGLKDDISRECDAAISPGRFCATDTAGKAVAISATGQISGEELLGVVLRNQARESKDYAAGEIAPIRRKGRVYVKTTSAVTEADQVFVEHTGADAGLVRNDVNGGDATALPSARFRKAVGSGELTILEVDL